MARAADEPATSVRRTYDSPVRRQQVAETRDRILTAASELVHGFASWDWRELTFRAVAEQAGVGERTVYRHFPTERQLHDAVMQRLEVEAGIRYEDVTLSNVGAVSERVFASLSRFAVGESTVAPEDPTFAVADQRRQDALRRAVDAARPDWTDEQREAAAAMLDVLWNLPTYERLVAHWKFDHDRAVKTIGWMLDHVLHEIERDAPPPV